MELAQPQGVASVAWWDAKNTITGYGQGQNMVRVAKAIEDSSDHKRAVSMCLRHLKLYANRDLKSLYDCGVAIGTYDGGVYLTMNVVQSCCDTIAAKLWKTPRIQCSVQDGDWTLKQRAKNLTGFCDGVWHANNWPGLSRQWGLDSTLFGSGVVATTGEIDGDDEGDVVIERVLRSELIFDETEAINGIKHLRSIYRKRWMHKELLLEKAEGWAGESDSKKDVAARRVAIQKAAGANPRERYLVNAADMVPVYEGWHIGSKADGSDGLHVIAIEGDSETATLFNGPWKRKRFPFSFLPWTPLPKGLIARSLAEELVPIQIRLNELLETIDAGQRLMCVPKVLFSANSINQNTWTNAFAEMIEVRGPLSQVQVINPAGVSAEIYAERDFWWRHSFEVTGISMLSATAQKPEGISSAVALRELLDREDMRLTPKGKQWEEANADVFECSIDAADELVERNRKVVVQVPRKNAFAKVEWGGVDMQRDQYILRADATNALPSTPQGRKQYATELYQLGAVNLEKFLSMLELPDTTSTINLVLASLDLTEKAMEIMIEEGRYEPPEEYSDLKLARAYGMQFFMRERMEGAPADVLDRLIRYVDECSEMIAANDNAAPAPASAPPVVPVGDQVVAPQVLPRAVAPAVQAIPETMAPAAMAI